MKEEKDQEEERVTAQDMPLFRAGLRVIINDMDITDGAAAHLFDISSVALSRILSGATKMPKQETISAICEETGLSVAEIVDRGRLEVGDNVDLSKLPPEALMNYVTKALGDCKEVLREIISQTEARLINVARDRNRLYNHVQRKKSILNALGDRVKSVNRDMEIRYCNEAYRCNKGRGIGEMCRDEDCEGHDCVAERVFATGAPVSDIVMRKGRWLGINAYPMKGQDGEVVEVVVSTRDIHEWHEKALHGEAKP